MQSTRMPACSRAAISAPQCSDVTMRVPRRHGAQPECSEQSTHGGVFVTLEVRYELLG
jgi:hypothetical protein